MNLDLTEEALEFGRTAQKAIEAAGGDALVRQAEREPERRGPITEPVLASLGAWELDVRRGVDELEAAAALCRAAGWWALPHPVAERLARPTDLGADGLVVVGDRRPAGAVSELDLRWAAVTVDGARSIARPQAPELSPRTGAFVTGLELEPVDRAAPVDVALALVLPCWTLLGMLDRAVDLTRRYVLDRHQFGQPLAAFQSVQFQLTEAEVERAGVDELAKYALWSIEADRGEVVDDALALRVAAVDAADVVFRIAHQLHGAIGFCDETTISWVSRYSAPLRRLPWGSSGSLDALTRRIGRGGLTGIYGGDAQ